MANCYPVKTPMESRLSLSILTEPEVNITIYQQLIGLLMYAMVCIYSNISYAMEVIAHHVSALGYVHIKIIKCIYCYLHSTSDYKLIY